MPGWILNVKTPFGMGVLIMVADVVYSVSVAEVRVGGVGGG